MQLRPYQTEISDKASELLTRLKIVYLAMEVRTGKTLTALETAKKNGAKKVLFITKKKAISSILHDYEIGGYEFEIEVTNYESLHKVGFNPDLLICDEWHKSGAYPKPNILTKQIKEAYSRLPMIFLSGTPSPESYSQFYHQFWVSAYSPFAQWKNFYNWAKAFVNVKDKHLGYAVVKDYSAAKFELIEPILRPYMITFTQKDAGFETQVSEKIIFCDMKPQTYNLCTILKRDNIIEGKEDVILAETAVKLMQKLHQMYSGTVILESGKALVFDYSKAEKIRDYFGLDKIAVFYKFKAEYEALKFVFGDNLTQDLDEFNNTSKNIALQIVTGREGISLKAAKYLIYYNIDFSAVSYWQSRDRLTTMERQNNSVFWIFAKGGIEEKIYQTVLSKKDFTLSHFKKLC